MPLLFECCVKSYEDIPAVSGNLPYDRLDSITVSRREDIEERNECGASC